MIEQIDKQIDILWIDKQIDGWLDKQMDRQINSETDRSKDKYKMYA